MVVSPLAGGIAFLLLGLSARLLGVRLFGFEEVTPRTIVYAMREQWRVVLMAMVFGTVGGWLIGIANKHYGPEATSFVGNLTICFLVFAGAVRGERLRAVELTAIAVIVSGTFLFSYESGQIAWALIGIMAAACMMTATKHVFMKQATAAAHMPSVMSGSLFLVSVIATGIASISGQWQIGSGNAFLVLMCTGVLGSTIGMTLLYRGYHFAGVARGASIDAGRPLAVLLIGLALGAAFPEWWQLIGGAMVLGGSMWLAYATKRPAAHRVDTGVLQPETEVSEASDTSKELPTVAQSKG